MQQSYQNNQEINKSIFNNEITEICEKSELLGDDWKIFEAEDDVLYLEKNERKFIPNQNEIYTLTYQAVFSESFSVPVLYLNVHKSNGKILDYNEIYSYFNLNTSQANSNTTSSSKFDEDATNLSIISQQDHPILCKPFYFLHPCKTIDWMHATKTNSYSKSNNYTLKWLSFVLASLNISFNIKYGLNKSELS